jgi:hypothetical protein
MSRNYDLVALILEYSSPWAFIIAWHNITDSNNFGRWINRIQFESDCLTVATCEAYYIRACPLTLGEPKARRTLHALGSATPAGLLLAQTLLLFHAQRCTSQDLDDPPLVALAITALACRCSPRVLSCQALHAHNGARRPRSIPRWADTHRTDGELQLLGRGR